MRLALALTLFLMAIAVSASAQDATKPAAGPSPDLFEQTPPPLPSATAALPDVSALDQAFNQTGLGKDADEMRMRLELRKLQNQVAQDPSVLAAKAAADSASTDLEKRERLREYYDINYGLMAHRAPSSAIRAAVEQSRKEHVGLLAQPRVRPNVFEPAPSATPKKKKAKKSGKRF